MNRKWPIMIGIILLAGVLRFWEVAEMPLRADEASVVFLSAEKPADIIAPFVSSDPHMPLYFLILHYWMLGAGQSELAVRFPGIFVGVLFAAVVYVLGRQVFPKRRSIAQIGALLAAINPFLIWDGQDVYMYSFLTVTAVGSFVLFLRVLAPRARWYHWAGYVVVSVLGLFFHYFAAFILMAQGVIWLWWTLTRRLPAKIAIGWVASQIAVALLFLPWLVHVFPLLANFKSDFIPAASLPEMLDRTLLVLTVGRADTRLAPTVVEPVLGNILAFGFLAVWIFGYFAPGIPEDGDDKRGPHGRVVLTIFLGIPLAAFYAFSIVRFPIFDERYMLYLTPPFFLIIARGIAAWLQVPKRRWIAAGALGFIALSSAHSLYNYFYVPEFARSPDWHGFMDRLFADARPGDALIQNYPDPALPYYLHDRMPRILLPRTDTDPMDQVSADLVKITSRFDRIWFQPVPYGSWDTQGLVAAWLDRHARQVDTFQFRGLMLESYLPVSVALRQAQPISATLGNQIQLLAFESTGADQTLKPGANLHVILYWKALAPIPRDDTVFVHLYRPDGGLEAQQDHQPVDGTYPTTDWKPDEIVVDQYNLIVPADAPSGADLLAAGMYDSQTLARLAAVDKDNKPLAENRIPLTTLRLDSAKAAP